MRFQRRRLLSAGAAAAAFLMAAGSAQAGLERQQLSAEVCEDLATADDEIRAFFENPANSIDTLDFDESDCVRLCKAVGKACEKLSKDGAKCFKDADSFDFKLLRALCDGDKACQDQVKQDQANSKEQTKLGVDVSRDDCEGLALDCFTACTENDEVFPAP